MLSEKLKLRFFMQPNIGNLPQVSVVWVTIKTLISRQKLEHAHQDLSVKSSTDQMYSHSKHTILIKTKFSVKVTRL